MKKGRRVLKNYTWRSMCFIAGERHSEFPQPIVYAAMGTWLFISLPNPAPQLHIRHVDYNPTPAAFLPSTNITGGV
jgi:hypothetical protein